MKADLTLPENRAAFMAQYYMQKVLARHDRPNEGPWLLNLTNMPDTDPDYDEIKQYYLSLRHISSLTEEEMKNLVCATILHLRKEQITHVALLSVSNKVVSYTYESDGQQFSSSIYVNHHLMWHLTAEWLIEKSFLIPWRGNSCDDLIASGVAVYREERKEGA